MPIASRRNARLAFRSALGALAFACVAPSGVRAQATIAPVVPSLGGEMWTQAGIARLDADLDAMVQNAPALRGAHAGVLAVDTATGAVLFARNADAEFQPASTLKLLVGSAALDRLGPAFRFHTEIDRVPSTPGKPGSPYDALIVRAGGDPFLAQANVDEAAREVADATPTRGIFVDDSRYDREPYAPGWTWDDFAYDYAARVSAMTFEENVAHLTVAPGDAVGQPAVVTAASPARVRTSPVDCDAFHDPVAIASRAVTGDAASDSTVDVSVGERCLEVFGSVPLGGAPEALDAAVHDPLLYARGALVAALRARGVAIDSTLAPLPDFSDAGARRSDPVGRFVWSHDSSQLVTWLGPRFWIPSDNLVGELLLKELGYATAGAPGSRASGIAFETSWLRAIGVDPATVTLADGCGMSQYDRVTPRALVAILQHDWNGPNRATVLDSLPVGGARGTIEGIAGTTAAGRVFAKTGSMMHVRGLAGYLATRHHGAVTFAFNVDDWLGDYAALASLRARVLARLIDD